MRYFTVSLLALLFTVSASDAADGPIAASVVSKAIDFFSRAPLNQDGRTAAITILKFAKSSPDVEVLTSSVVTPWMAEDGNPKFKPVLLVAYYAGNIRSQLAQKVAKNDPYAGLLQVMKTYDQIRGIDDDYYSAGITRFKELEARRELKAYLERELSKK